MYIEMLITLILSLIFLVLAFLPDIVCFIYKKTKLKHTMEEFRKNYEKKIKE